jgi:ApaG protein
MRRSCQGQATQQSDVHDRTNTREPSRRQLWQRGSAGCERSRPGPQDPRRRQREQSKPEEGHYAFSYTITIRNEGQVPARLLTRHWVITDANGKVKEVRGEGVVGEQPYLLPGQGFRYSSGAVLETPVGAMQGSYQMLADDGAHFDAPIAPFTLAMPGLLH